MRRTAVFLLLFGLGIMGMSAAQEPPPHPQVPGFPPFSPAPTMLEVVEDRGDTVLVRHALGETEVPKNPQRVYTDDAMLEPLVALGIVPVASSYIGAAAMPEALAQQVEGTTTIYPYNTVNLEGILAAQPELIVVYNLFWEGGADLYNQLSAVAPTLVMNGDAFAYPLEAMRDVAKVLGREAQAAFARFEEVVDEQCARIREVVGGGTLTLSVAYAPRYFGLLGPGNLVEGDFVPYTTSRLYSLCGVRPGPEVIELAGTEASWAELSLELLPELRADYLVVFSGRGAGAYLEEFTAHPLWNRIKAVQEGNAHVIEEFVDTASYYGVLEGLEQVADVIAGTRTERSEP